MSPVDKATQDIIQAEFHKERQDIDRFRKEQVRREIHQTRIDEQQKTQKKLNLLSLDEQRTLEKKEQKKAKKKAKEQAVEEEKKNDLYNACDIYIMNSHKTNHKGDSEGFGITFLESNACGKPIIGTESGGIPDAISNYKNGLLIEPNNPSKTAAAILKLFNDNDLYNRLSINGRFRIENNFSINKIGNKYLKIISNYYDY